MSTTTTFTPDFIAMAQELTAVQDAQRASQSVNGLIPSEAYSRMQREGEAFLRAPSLRGATVDQEGLNNNYGIEPEMYFASFPSQEQAQQYITQGIAAAALVIGLILTSVAVS